MPAYYAKPQSGLVGYNSSEDNGLLSGVRRLSKNVATWATERRAYSEAVRELSSLSDRDLADIGIARADIEAVARDAAKGKAARG